MKALLTLLAFCVGGTIAAVLAKRAYNETELRIVSQIGESSIGSRSVHFALPESCRWWELMLATEPSLAPLNSIQVKLGDPNKGSVVQKMTRLSRPESPKGISGAYLVGDVHSKMEGAKSEDWVTVTEETNLNWRLFLQIGLKQGSFNRNGAIITWDVRN